jgi:hypothetical protein
MNREILTRENKLEYAVRDILEWIATTPSGQCHGSGLHRVVAQAQDALTVAAPSASQPDSVVHHRPVSLRRFQTGAIIRHKNGADGYIVTANYGGHAVAVRTITVSNPSEWDVIHEGAG